MVVFIRNAKNKKDRYSVLSDEYHDYERLTNRVATKTMLKLQTRI